MTQFIKEFLQIFTPEGLVLLLNICITKIVLSWDNAIVIGMATKNLPEDQRRKAIIFGIAAATIMRIVFSFFAVWMLGILWLKLVWGILLLYVVWKFYKDIRMQSEWSSLDKSLVKVTVSSAIFTIIMADLSMSLDNVLAVAWASHGNIALLSIWLAISIALMAFAANIIAGFLDRFPQIQWLGLIIILFIALEMVHDGSIDVGLHAIHFNILPFISLLVWILFIFLQQKHIAPLEEKKIKLWVWENYLYIILALLFSLMMSFLFGENIEQFMVNHPIILNTILFAFLFVILELLSLARKPKKMSIKEKLKKLF